MGSLVLSLLLVTALCVFSDANGISKREDDTVKVVLCEGQHRTIECESHIQIQSVMFGRTSSTVCPVPTSWPQYYNIIRCADKKAMDIVNGSCNDKSKCDLSASIEFFGPACHIPKPYLEVSYTCIEAEVKIHTESVCEDQSKLIMCESGKTIQIKSAMYGRMSVSICSGGAIYSKQCQSHKAMPKISGYCTGKQICQLVATNEVFGDPCPGTHKYLEVNYTCIKSGK